MMEILLIALAVGLITFVLMMIAFAVGRARQKHEAARFHQYLVDHFPDLASADMLVAARRSKGKHDAALLVAEAQGEIIVLLDDGPAGVRHLAYPFSALTGVNSTSQIISRGVPPSRAFSYEQTMTVTFNDGSAIPFILEMISNKHGSDQAPQQVAAVFAPWEQKLHAIRPGLQQF
jgi:hypothetical protein